LTLLRSLIVCFNLPGIRNMFCKPTYAMIQLGNTRIQASTSSISMMLVILDPPQVAALQTEVSQMDPLLE
jgi:hypothetical protein